VKADQDLTADTSLADCSFQPSDPLRGLSGTASHQLSKTTVVDGLTSDDQGSVHGTLDFSRWHPRGAFVLGNLRLHQSLPQLLKTDIGAVDGHPHGSRDHLDGRLPRAFFVISDHGVSPPWSLEPDRSLAWRSVGLAGSDEKLIRTALTADD
jgi:hypothetical protein